MGCEGIDMEGLSMTIAKIIEKALNAAVHQKEYPLETIAQHTEHDIRSFLGHFKKDRFTSDQAIEKITEILATHILPNSTTTDKDIVSEIIGIIDPAPISTLTFMDRLIKERDELKDKFEKLTQFLESGKSPEVVGARQFEMLKAQQSFMDGYLLVLNDRIKDLQAISSPSQN